VTFGLQHPRHLICIWKKKGKKSYVLKLS
jgi:hypothetical protein